MSNGAATDRNIRIVVSKLEAAKRQLNLAIELWFMGRDDVSVHTLAAASYQIIHDLNEHHGTSHTNLFKPNIVKPNAYKEWSMLVRKPSNFFKHADNDPESKMELVLFGTTLYFVFCISGLGFLKSHSSDEERIFAMWLYLHEPDLVIEGSEWGDLLKRNVTDNQLKSLSALSKKEFFEVSNTSHLSL